MLLSDISNIHGDNTSQTSLAKILLIFYILVASNCTENLLSKQTRDIINHNRYIQHMIGFMTLFVLITLVGDQVDTRTAMVYALFGYIWFVFSTKLDIHWNIAIIILLFIGYMYENNTKIRVIEIKNDNSLSESQKLYLLNDIESTNTWIVGSIIIVTILGTFFYSQKKQEQYGGGYDVFTYFLN
jgi:hypothetical protein